MMHAIRPLFNNAKNVLWLTQINTTQIVDSYRKKKNEIDYKSTNVLIKHQIRTLERMKTPF